MPFFFFMCETVPIRTVPIQGQPLPPDYGPPPYEAPQPGFLPPHVPGEGPMPMPMPLPPPGSAHSLHLLNEHIKPPKKLTDTLSQHLKMSKRMCQQAIPYFQTLSVMFLATSHDVIPTLFTFYLSPVQTTTSPSLTNQSPVEDSEYHDK